MMDKPRFAVLGSTRGSSFLPILEAWKLGELNCDPVVVFSNRKQSGILVKAREAGIATEWIPSKDRDRAEYDQEVSSILRRYEIDFILLIGYMRILSSEFVNDWSNKIANVHPSLLPKYGGMMDLEIHEAVIAAGDSITGCSVHLVTEEVDGGPILIQKQCDVAADDSAMTLKAKVQQLEGEAFLQLLGTPRSYFEFQE